MICVGAYNKWNVFKIPFSYCDFERLWHCLKQKTAQSQRRHRLARFVNIGKLIEFAIRPKPLPAHVHHIKSADIDQRAMKFISSPPGTIEAVRNQEWLSVISKLHAVVAADAAAAAAAAASSASSRPLHEGEQTAWDLPNTLRVPISERARCLPHMKHDIVAAPKEVVAAKGEPDTLDL